MEQQGDPARDRYYPEHAPYASEQEKREDSPTANGKAVSAPGESGYEDVLSAGAAGLPDAAARLQGIPFESKGLTLPGGGAAGGAGSGAGHPKKEKAAQPVRRRSRIWRVLGFSFLGMFLLLLSGAGWAYWKGMQLYEQSNIAALGKEPQKPTVLYDRNGEVITELTNSRFEYIPLDQVAPIMLEAIVAVEDSRFYEHKGVDLQGIARATYKNLRAGAVVEGGSTITQQLAKMTLFSSEQTYSRKLNEAMASLKIENTYTKDQILEMYLNSIYYGNGAYGIQRAAQIYFGKPASELTLAEAALLAGMPKAPSNYSPVDNPDKALARRNLVLQLMASQGKITAEERDAAIAEPIKLIETPILKQVDKYPSYVNYVIQEAIVKHGLTEKDILSQGLAIYTNLDPKVQNALTDVYNNNALFPEDAGGLQSSAVVLDPASGAIRGIAAGRNFYEQKFRSFNYATQLKRQPGSSIKPVVVFAPALMAGFKPNDLVNDVETEFATGYKPLNYGKKEHGWITLEEALIQSYNIPAVALLNEVGIGKALDFGRRAGLPLLDEDRVLGTALGGLQQGVSPLQMAQAYTMFANGGKMAEAYAITKIVDRQGQVLKEAKPQAKQLLDPSIAYQMTQMLQKVITNGTGQMAQIGRPVAGKTGTTQLPNIAEFKDARGNQLDGSKDAWFVGYTPELVTAIWLGYPMTNKTHYLTTTGGKEPAKLFREVMTRALDGVPASDFVPPENFTPIGGQIRYVNGEYPVTPTPAKRVAVVSKPPAETPAPPDMTPQKAAVPEESKETNGKGQEPGAGKDDSRKDESRDDGKKEEKKDEGKKDDGKKDEKKEEKKDDGKSGGGNKDDEKNNDKKKEAGEGTSPVEASPNPAGLTASGGTSSAPSQEPTPSPSS
ncbi:hypothetical protein J31TS4_36510 [Paenibacillus sp. J31TS4]|nr:hypothetical protein J31TS4_36510 [Paenibacillus sp. J31TS4]